MLFKAPEYGPVQLFQREEGHPREFGVYTRVKRTDMVLHKAFIPGPAAAGGQDATAVMVGHVQKVLVQGGIILAAFAHGALQVVGDQHFGNPAIVMQRILHAGDKVLLLLAGGSLRIGVLALAKD
ncbi:hypothetical protein SDC9_128410 [bioreactor metagenome]|uniref:Uncharacterized protein n=1 Tax=bioreactor metagenome TaxID=1076179 RepID=A0A645CWR9_9ZZZZ